jgi:nitrogen regulatory protein P-II 1
LQKIEAIIREESFDSIKTALEESGFISMTICEVMGRGQQKGFQLRWNRNSEHRVEFLPKIKLELVVEDKNLDRALDIICDNARTGSIGDGKIFVMPVGEVIRVRSGERGAQAV